MEVFETIKTRRSIRKYLDKPIERAMITKILEAGKASPSAGNLQPWRFILVEDAETKKKLAEASIRQWWMTTAPFFIVVCGLQKKVKRFYTEKGSFYCVQSCGAAIENMLLMANSLGLGACWVGAFNEERVKSLLDIPEDVEVEAIITLGFADEAPKEPIEESLWELTYFNKYGNRSKDLAMELGIYSEVMERGLKGAGKAIKKGITKLKEKFK